MAEHQKELPRVLEAVQIPRSVLVPCPAKSFANRRAAVCCPECPHFRGVVQVQEGPAADWPQAYRIFCAHPVSRRVTMIDDEE